MVEQARSDGADRVLLHVVETNPTAERLYARCGFVRTGATLRLPHHPDLLEHEMVLPLWPGGAPGSADGGARSQDPPLHRLLAPHRQ